MAEDGGIEVPGKLKRTVKKLNAAGESLVPPAAEKPQPGAVC